ncbi:MAG: metallophosphoesterase [Bacteroidales bacterium]|nr:metallophosphoesterase [Candidatus Cryptobacteroides aphodequi]
MKRFAFLRFALAAALVFGFHSFSLAGGASGRSVAPGKYDAGQAAEICAAGGRERDAAEFVFVQITDTQIGFTDKTEHFHDTDSLMRDAILAINAIHPVAVFNTGDLVNKFGNQEQKDIYTRNLSEMDSDIPYWVVPGNHDIRGFNQKNYDGYMAFVGYDRFSVRYNDCAFIGIDSNRIKDDNEYAAAAEEEQFEWLLAELKAAKKCRYTFVFMHCPVAMTSLDEADGHNSFPMAKRERYISAFKKYGVDAIFSGHSHCYSYFEDGGIQHINSMPVTHAFNGAYPSINIVTVGPDGFTFKYVAGAEVIAGE